MKKSKKSPTKPANSLLDSWSLVHFLSGILLGWIMSPFIALLLMIAWEPLERFVLSPNLAKKNVVFGNETYKNSFADILVDATGITIGSILLTWLVAPPFKLF